MAFVTTLHLNTFTSMDENKIIYILNAHFVHFNQLPVLVRNEECSFDVTTIWIFAFAVEHFFVIFVVV